MIHDWDGENNTGDYHGDALVIEDEQHGSNQTWAEIARKRLCPDVAEELRTPPGLTSLGSRIATGPSWL